MAHPTAVLEKFQQGYNSNYQQRAQGTIPAGNADDDVWILAHCSNIWNYNNGSTIPTGMYFVGTVWNNGSVGNWFRNTSNSGIGSTASFTYDIQVGNTVYTYTPSCMARVSNHGGGRQFATHNSQYMSAKSHSPAVAQDGLCLWGVVNGKSCGTPPTSTLAGASTARYSLGRHFKVSIPGGTNSTSTGICAYDTTTATFQSSGSAYWILSTDWPGGFSVLYNQSPHASATGSASVAVTATADGLGYLPGGGWGQVAI
jgi:hypothetical protein